MRKTVALFAFCAGLFAAHAQNLQAIDPAKGLVLPNAAGPRLLWEIVLGRGTQTRTFDNNYKPCNYAALEKTLSGERAILEWNDLRFHLEDRVVTVRVTVDLPRDSGVAEWRIFVEN